MKYSVGTGSAIKGNSDSEMSCVCDGQTWSSWAVKGVSICCWPPATPLSVCAVMMAESQKVWRLIQFNRTPRSESRCLSNWLDMQCCVEFSIIMIFFLVRVLGESSYLDNLESTASHPWPFWCSIICSENVCAQKNPTWTQARVNNQNLFQSWEVLDFYFFF